MGGRWRRNDDDDAENINQTSLAMHRPPARHEPALLLVRNPVPLPSPRLSLYLSFPPSFSPTGLSCTLLAWYPGFQDTTLASAPEAKPEFSRPNRPDMGSPPLSISIYP
ncbi:hypothetical protein CP532_3138 [Ophiocordyceps camponoti-leonardi (nom. inval.)]|nr:hypothetical protein CP532_3138 [Ophiocordyceps camponoti-leonardi (nom. inval.)]